MATNISEFINLVRPDVLTCPEPILSREVISVLLDFCSETQIFQTEFQLDISSESIDTAIQDSMDLDISSYNDGMRPVTLIDITVDGIPFYPRNRDIQNTLTHWSTFKDESYKYFKIIDEDTLRVYDMDDSDSVIWIRMALKPLRTATSITDESLFENWSDAIVAGAKWKILSMPGKSWSDPRAGEFYRQEYRRYLSEASAYVLKGASAEDLHIEWKSFGEID